MIVLKNLEIEESLTRITKVNRWHECAYCAGIIGFKQEAIKASFRYDKKLYPLYFHNNHDKINCFQNFKNENDNNNH